MTTVFDGELTAGMLLLAEYEQLKEEQRARIGFRDNLLYVTLASMGAVAFSALQGPGRPALLLLLPPVTFVLGWTYLMNDQKVSTIGGYIRTQLAPRIVALMPERTPELSSVFGWEGAHRADRRRMSRKITQLVVDLMLFCLSAVVAVVFYWTQGSPDPVLLGVSCLEVIVVIMLAIQILRYVEVQP